MERLKKIIDNIYQLNYDVEQKLYVTLIQKQIDSNSNEPFDCSTEELLKTLKVTRNTMKKARGVLVEKRLISYTPGTCRKDCSSYQVLDLIEGVNEGVNFNAPDPLNSESPYMRTNSYISIPPKGDSQLDKCYKQKDKNNILNNKANENFLKAKFRSVVAQTKGSEWRILMSKKFGIQNWHITLVEFYRHMTCYAKEDVLDKGINEVKRYFTNSLEYFITPECKRPHYFDKERYPHPTLENWDVYLFFGTPHLCPHDAPERKFGLEMWNPNSYEWVIPCSYNHYPAGYEESFEASIRREPEEKWREYIKQHYNLEEAMKEYERRSL